MKKIILILIMLCFLSRIAISSQIDVGVPEGLKGKISSLVYDNTSNIVKLPVEFYNTGTNPYYARIKAEILYGNETVFRGWSQQKELMPGDKKVFDIYWYNNSVGKYSAKLKVYFGDEVLEYENFELSISKSLEPKDVFEIKDLRTYDNFIVFELKSSEDAKNIVILPDKYPLGMIFEQKEIDKINNNSSKIVVINYYPNLWKPSEISLLVASDNGKYFTEKSVDLSKQEGLLGSFYYVIDSLKIALFS